jgi:hypothetical protein
MPEGNGLVFDGIQKDTKQLISLEQFNKDVYDKGADAQAPQLNGIACPSCGEEMLDLVPHVILPTQPPQKNVCCTSCGFQGYRYA